MLGAGRARTGVSGSKSLRARDCWHFARDRPSIKLESSLNGVTQMYDTILLATDGSKLADAAVAEAGRIGGPGSEVLVVEIVDGTDGKIVAAAPLAVASLRRTAQEHLDAAEKLLTEVGFEDVRTAVLDGHAGPAIVKAAEENDCNVIVMATHGRSGVKRAVLGSVADYVVRHTERIPVLLVHPGAKAA